MFVKVEEHILLAKLRAILRKEEEKPEEERDQEFIALAYETMAHLEMACTRFRRHRVRCFDGAGGGSWRDGSLPASSSLRACG
jgi:hypothetical protein